MSEERKMRCGGGGPAAGGAFWFAGWLFTIAFAHLSWWQALLGLIVWPWFLGVAVG